jgi:hypothetical protein
MTRVAEPTSSLMSLVLWVMAEVSISAHLVLPSVSETAP